jgi:hypothetical protein
MRELSRERPDNKKLHVYERLLLLHAWERRAHLIALYG